MHVYRYSRGSVIEWRQGAAYSSTGSPTGTAAQSMRWRLYTSSGYAFTWRSGGAATSNPTGSSARTLRWHPRNSRGGIRAWYSTGSLESSPGLPTITTKPYAGWSRATLPNTVIPFVKVINPADGTVTLALSNQTTASDATLTIANAALTAGTPYLVVSFNAAGTARGIDLYTAA